MKIVLMNILAVIAGLVGGSVLNMVLVETGMALIIAPEGFDPSSMESMKETGHLLQGEHYVFPLIAHAGGTLVGAYITARIASSWNFGLSMLIGVLFLVGGIMAATMIPAPTWFLVIDLAAYLPAAWLGHKFTMK